MGLVSVKVMVLVAPGAIGSGAKLLAMVGGVSVTVKVPENSEVDKRSGQVAVQVVVALKISPAAPAKLWGKDSTPEPVWVILTNEAYISPSPLPDGSAPEGFLKNSMR